MSRAFLTFRSAELLSWLSWQPINREIGRITVPTNSAVRKCLMALRPSCPAGRQMHPTIGGVSCEPLPNWLRHAQSAYIYYASSCRLSVTSSESLLESSQHDFAAPVYNSLTNPYLLAGSLRKSD